MKEGLRQRGLELRQARRMEQDRSEWRGFVRGSCVTSKRKPFLRHTTDGNIGHSGGSEQATSGGTGPRFSSNV